MRKIWRSSKWPCTKSLSSRARREIVAERLLDHDAGAAALDVGVEARAAQTRDHSLEELWQRREVEDVVASCAVVAVARVERGAEAGPRGLVVERAGHVLRARHVLLEGVERVGMRLLHRDLAFLEEPVVALLGTGHAEQAEVRWELAALGQRCDGGVKLALREVSGGAEHDERDSVDVLRVRHGSDSRRQWIARRSMSTNAGRATGSRLAAPAHSTLRPSSPAGFQMVSFASTWRAGRAGMRPTSDSRWWPPMPRSRCSNSFRGTRPPHCALRTISNRYRSAGARLPVCGRTSA